MLRLLLTSLLLTASAFPLAFAGSDPLAPDCACAGSDPRASKDPVCVRYKPVKAVQNCFDGRGADETCADPLSQVAPEASKLHGLVGEDIKSFAETRDYISCYRGPFGGFRSGNEQYCHFKKTLAPYIRLAAESAGLRPALMACLVKAESEFWSKADSGPAQGYPQFTEGTRLTINNILFNMTRASIEATIRTRQAAVDALQARLDAADLELEPIDAVLEPLKLVAREQERDVARATAALRKKPRDAALKKELTSTRQALLSTRKEIAAEQKKAGSRLYKRNVIRAEIAGLKEDLRAAVAQRKVKEVWADYWEGSKPVPTQVDLKSVQCPRIAFAVAAVKKIHDLHALFDEEDIERTPQGRYKVKGLSELETGLYLAGAYNAGYGGFEDKCDPDRIGRCLDIRHRPPRLKEETSKHMVAVDHCARTGSTKPGRWDWRKFKAPEDKNCEAFKCGK